MSSSSGVDWLFDVLFHEIMEGWPIARQKLNDRLAKLYASYTPSQQLAVDNVFRELCHQSFSECFKVSDKRCSLVNLEMIRAKDSMNLSPPLKQGCGH